MLVGFRPPPKIFVVPISAPNVFESGTATECKLALWCPSVYVVLRRKFDQPTSSFIVNCQMLWTIKNFWIVKFLHEIYLFLYYLTKMYHCWKPVLIATLCIICDHSSVSIIVIAMRPRRRCVARTTWNCCRSLLFDLMFSCCLTLSLTNG